MSFSKTDVMALQKALTNMGFSTRGIDGIVGNNTRNAAAAFSRGDSPTVKATPQPTGVIRQGSAGYQVREIVIHTSATRPEWMEGWSTEDKVKEIKRWHVEGNGWSDIGYHWLIDRDGTTLPGRAEHVIGAGVAGHNRGVIHVCLFGGHGSSERDMFSEHYTEAQRLALNSLVADIKGRAGITLITGHNRYAAKACPGFNVTNYVRENSL